VLQIFQMIHFITMALGGDGYLNFMGNEVISSDPSKLVSDQSIFHDSIKKFIPLCGDCARCKN
jgi:hypothetical protein